MGSITGIGKHLVACHCDRRLLFSSLPSDLNPTEFHSRSATMGSITGVGKRLVAWHCDRRLLCSSLPSDLNPTEFHSRSATMGSITGVGKRLVAWHCDRRLLCSSLPSDLNPAELHSRFPTMGDIEPVNRQLPPMDCVQAVLFDVDGTLADSDPFHYLAFRDMLAEMGYNDGVPITEEFFSAFISGKHNPDIGLFLFPDWDQPRRDQWLDDKEALFRRMAAEQLQPVGGLLRLAEWVKQKGFRRAAVTNAPRLNAEQMIAAVGLTDFFEHLVIGSECARGKPFPDPYLNALEHFGVSAEHAFAFEDSPAGLAAAVAAGLPVVGITTGNPGPALLAAGAAFLIKDYDDPALWSKLEGGS